MGFQKGSNNLIGYNLKLPKQKNFIKVQSKEDLKAGRYIVFEGTQYKVKRKFMTNEVGHMIEVTETKDKADHLIEVVRRIRYDLI